MNDVLENLIKINLQNRYFNQPHNNEYLDDITSKVLFPVITEFGSPENIFFFKNQRINEINFNLTLNKKLNKN